MNCTSKLATSFALLMGLVACNKAAQSDSGSTASYNVLNVTGAVAGASSASLQAASTGVLFKTGTLAGNANAYYAFMDGQQFFNQGKSGDMMACFVKKLAEHGVIATDGTPTYFDMDEGMKMKMSAVLDTATNTITQYNLYSCSIPQGQSSYSQDQYIGSNISNGSASISFKVNNSTLQIAMDIAGTVDNGAWISKSITQHVSISSYISKSTITQTASTLESQSAFSFSSGGSTTTIQQNSLSSLFGTTEATYALGQGSAKVKITQNGTPNPDNTVSWDDSGADAVSSSHEAAVSSAAYLAVPSSSDVNSATAFTAGQTWDCQATGGTVANMTSMNASTQTDIQACMQ